MDRARAEEWDEARTARDELRMVKRTLEEEQDATRTERDATQIESYEA